MPANLPTTDAGCEAIKALAADPARTLLALDFDGTLAPIVDDPEKAHAHPRSLAAFARLGALLGNVVLITGRPVETALRLGGFAGVAGLENMVILGQYGVERWDAATGDIVSPPVPAGVGELLAILPDWLAGRDQGGVRIEDKGRAFVLHTRGLTNADEMLDSLLDPLAALAAEHGLVAEPGRHVIEVRAADCDKGAALRGIVEQTGMDNIIFAGDDIGDLPAFFVAEELREEGHTALLVCSASVEQDALLEHADLVLAGPEAVADWLEGLAAGLEQFGTAS